MHVGQLSRRVARALRARGGGAPPPPAASDYDSWLTAFHDDVLAPLDAACAQGASPTAFAGLDVDLWALLLTQQYSVYPNLRAALPEVPQPAMQERWCGRSGVPLALQSAAFYRLLTERYAQAGARPLDESRVLDFGCGWGRLTRYLIRDVPPERLCGCDPVASILAECRVPATLAQSDFFPERLPFEEPFDLAFAFSVFTHLSEAAHERCLDALHAGLRPGGILVVTIRPPAYLQESPFMGEVRDREDDAYVFAPHPADPGHPQYAGSGEMSYGETVIALPYVRERWASRFELLHVDLFLQDLHQVVLTLRRRG